MLLPGQGHHHVSCCERAGTCPLVNEGTCSAEYVPENETGITGYVRTALVNIASATNFYN